MRHKSFSLKLIFVVMAVGAFLVYRVIPITTEIYCDRITMGVPATVDILGRNRNEKFEVVLTGVDVISDDGSPDRSRGSSSIRVAITVYSKQRLQKYEIIGIRESR